MAVATRALAETLINVATLHLGKDYAAAQEKLTSPLPTEYDRDGFYEFMESLPPGDIHTKEEVHFAANTIKLGDAIHKVIRNERLSEAEEYILRYFYHPLKLPHNLRRYGFFILNSTRFYDAREEFLGVFRSYLRSSMLPAFRYRLTRFGVKDDDIHSVLKENPDINPVYALWLLGGIVPPFDRENNVSRFSPDALRFAHALLGRNPKALAYGKREAGEIDNRPLRALFDIDGLPSRETWSEFKFLSGHVFTNYLTFTSFLPIGLNAEFDVVRIEAAKKLFAGDDERDGQKFYYTTRLTNQDIIFSRSDGKISRHMNRRITQRAHLTPFGSYDPAFFADFEKKLNEWAHIDDQLAWEKIPEFLRLKCEAAGYGSASKIVDAFINRDQARVVYEPIIMIRNAMERFGYIPNETDVLAALMYPHRARFAGGMAVNRLHARLRKLIAPKADFDDFYGLEKQEPKTLEQIAVADFWGKIEDYTEKDDLLKHTVTEQQRTALMDVPVGGLVYLAENLDKAYIEKTNEPSETLEHLQETFGISISLEDCLTIREEKREAVRLARHTAEKEREELRHQKLMQRKQRTEQAQSKPKNPAPVNPWAEIPASIVELCSRKGFGSFDAVVEAVKENIARRMEQTQSQGRPQNLNRHARLALQNLAVGFLPSDNRPITIMHALMAQVLRLTPDIIKELRKKSANPDMRNGAAGKALVQANFVRAVIDNPQLSHIVSWPQLAEERKGTDIVKLSENLANAYRVISPRALQIGANTALIDAVRIVSPDATQDQLRPERFVPLPIWLESYRARSGSVIGAGVKAEALTIR